MTRTLTLKRTTTLLAALAASALSFAAALAPMSVHAAPSVDQAIAACGAAWSTQAGGVQDVRMNSIDDSSRQIKLSLRARDGAGAKITTRCVVDARGQVLTIGGTPVTQIASGAR